MIRLGSNHPVGDAVFLPSTLDGDTIKWTHRFEWKTIRWGNYCYNVGPPNVMFVGL